MVRGKRGAILGLSLCVPPDRKSDSPKAGGIRAFGVHPSAREKGLGTAFLDESCRILKSLGATRADFLTTPPYHITPGVDTRQTDFISWLIRRKFRHAATIFNMRANLKKWKSPMSRANIFDRDEGGYYLRRATTKDRAAYIAHCRKHWSRVWELEGLIALSHDPPTMFLCMKSPQGNKSAIRKASTAQDELVGFVVYESNMGPGSFGPTAVLPKHQGYGLGRRMLYAAMLEMKSLGRDVCDIGWIGPVEFYSRAAGATLGPSFWKMRKVL